MTVEGLGIELYHVGIVVRDLHEGMERFGSAMGVATWITFESALPSRYRGVPVTAGAKAAYGDSGAIYVELVEPTGDRWTATTFLEERGEGVYHLGYWADDVPGAVARAAELGIGVDWAAEADGKPFIAYLEAVGGVHMELVAGSIKPVMQQRFGIAPR